MRKMQNFKRSLMSLALLLSLVSASSVYAQDSTSSQKIASVSSQAAQQKKVTVTEAFVVEAEKTAIERDSLRSKVANLESIIVEKDIQLEAKQGLLDLQKTITKDWREAAMERRAALAVDTKMIEGWNLERVRLIDERDSARRSGLVKGIVGAAVGFGIGVLTSRNR